MAAYHLKCLYSIVEVNDSLKSFQATGHHFIIVAQFASFYSVSLLDFVLRTHNLQQERHQQITEKACEYTTVQNLFGYFAKLVLEYKPNVFCFETVLVQLS